MTTTETTGYAVADAEQDLWLGRVPAAWADVVRSVDPEQVQDAASMVAAAGLGWTVEQHPMEAVLQREPYSQRVPVPFIGAGSDDPVDRGMRHLRPHRSPAAASAPSRASGGTPARMSARARRRASR